jgi:hypothetical protein
MFIDARPGLSEEITYAMLFNAASNMSRPQRVKKIYLGYYMGVSVLAHARDTLFNLLLLRPADVIVITQGEEGEDTVIERGLDGPRVPDLESMYARDDTLLIS